MLSFFRTLEQVKMSDREPTTNYMSMVPQFMIGGLIFSSITAGVWLIVYLGVQFLRYLVEKYCYWGGQQRVTPIESPFFASRSWKPVWSRRQSAAPASIASSSDNNNNLHYNSAQTTAAVSPIVSMSNFYRSWKRTPSPMHRREELYHSSSSSGGQSPTEATGPSPQKSGSGVKVVYQNNDADNDKHHLLIPDHNPVIASCAPIPLEI